MSVRIFIGCDMKLDASNGYQMLFTFSIREGEGFKEPRDMTSRTQESTHHSNQQRSNTRGN